MSAPYAADLELARRCADGDEAAWERFVLEYRPLLYRAADTLDRTGSARELADSLYADLYGVKRNEAGRRSLLEYFQGRSSLATWLRSVLAQRFVDRLRAQRRLVPLPEEALNGKRLEPEDRFVVAGVPPDPDRSRYLALVHRALDLAITKLPARERLRLGCYYVQQLTLAETGRLMKEHEATVSRQLARTRRAIREEIERHLRDDAGLNDDQIAECFSNVVQDSGSLDLKEMLNEAAPHPGMSDNITEARPPIASASPVGDRATRYP